MAQAQLATLTTQDVYGNLILGWLVAGGGFEPPIFGL